MTHHSTTQNVVDELAMQKVNEDLIKSSLITPDQIYADLILFKDYNIGAILSFLKERKDKISQEEYSSLYEKIIDTLHIYNKRDHDDLAYIFSFMNITNSDIQERLLDERCSSFILHHSPVTKFLDTLAAQIFVNANHSAVIGKKDPVSLTLNTYPLKLSKEDEVMIGYYFSTKYNVNVRVMYLDMKTINLSHIFKYDEIYTYYLKEILDSQDVRESYTAMKFVTKRLFAARLFGKKVLPEQAAEKEELIISTRLDILTQFKFIHARFFSTSPVTEKETNANG